MDKKFNFFSDKTENPNNSEKKNKNWVTDLPKTRKVDIEGHQYTQHRDEIHNIDEAKYSAIWKQPGMYTGGKRDIPKTIPDDMYLWEQGIIPKKQLMSAHYSIEKEGKVYHVFNAENIYWYEMINKITVLIRGKHKPIYKINQYTHGDKVIVVNIEKCKMPGGRQKYWRYHYHSGWPGGMKERSYKEILFRRPEMLLFKDVNRALPKNTLRKLWLKNLKAFRGPHHDYDSFLPHFAEKPAMDKFQQLPDGHFEEKIAIAKAGPGPDESWGGTSPLDYDGYIKALSDPDNPGEKVIIQKGQMKRMEERAKKYFAHLRRTDDYRPKPPRNKVQEYHEERNSGKPSFKIFKSDKEVRKYGQDYMFDIDEEKSDSGEDDK